jgi:hypothetical protein
MKVGMNAALAPEALGFGPAFPRWFARELDAEA